MNRLSNKSVLITGAGSGIGEAAALLFAREGARVVVADIVDDAGQRTVEQITAAGGEAVFVHADVTQEEDVARAVETAVNMYGRIDVLYNNAGGSTRKDGMLTEVPIEEFWNAIRLNLFSVWLACRQAIPHFMQSGGGSIINVATIGVLIGLRRVDAYTAAKGGVAALTRSLAVEYGPHNIRVNAIAPTTTMTDRVKALHKSRVGGAPTIERNLLGTAAPIDIANMALYLASDESRITTGQVFAIDSGFSIG